MQLAMAHVTTVSTAAPHTSRAAATISRAGREAIMAPQYVFGRAFLAGTGLSRMGPAGLPGQGPAFADYPLSVTHRA